MSAQTEIVIQWRAEASSTRYALGDDFGGVLPGDLDGDGWMATDGSISSSAREP